MNVIGHEALLRELRALALAEDPPHALLFAGQEGTGRRPLALEYARILNCEAEPDRRPCGECRSCRLIGEGRHPDVVFLSPGDTLCRPRPNESRHDPHPQSRDIRICQVRGLIDLVSRYPFEARYRAILIDPAERIGREASHTILKTLEEPPGHTVFLLLTSAREAIIETILSRCRRFDVFPVPRAEIEAALEERGVEARLAARAAAESRGRPGLALSFAERPDLMEDRSRLLDRCAAVAAGGNAERFAYAGQMAERWRRDRAVVGSELDAWAAFWELQLRQAAVAAHEAARARAATAALQAVLQARTDLQAQVLPRLALELMLLSFPRVTIEGATERAPAPDD